VRITVPLTATTMQKWVDSRVEGIFPPLFEKNRYLFLCFVF
jgi:hypothetical protein